MTNQANEDASKGEWEGEMDALMDAYNPPPLKAEQPAHFYWEMSPQEQASDGAVQSAFEN